MTTTYPLATLGPTVSATGISAPAYSDIYASLQASFQSIYGSDSYIDPDSQDGQMLAIIAKAIADCNAQAIAVYNSYGPATAQGVGLSNAVKIVGLTRQVSTDSSVDVTVTGVVGTVINNGVVADTNGNQWALPAVVTIPPAGYVIVTATCQTPGSIAAAAGTVTLISTPTLGWQSVTNASAASAGAPVESDAALRQRQTISVALPALTILAGLIAAVQALAGVTAAIGLENDTSTTDANGLPGHSFSLVVAGGDATQIATTILVKKAPGALAYGTTVVVVEDSTGLPYNIGFYVPTPIPISVVVSIHAGVGYLSPTGALIQQALVNYIAGLPLNTQVLALTRLYPPAYLNGASQAGTYEITNLQIAIKPNAVASADLDFTFYQQITLALADVTITLV